jgi:hypothetical protein
MHTPSCNQVVAKEEEFVKEMDRQLSSIIAFFLRKEAETVSRLEVNLILHAISGAGGGEMLLTKNGGCGLRTQALMHEISVG